MKSHELVNGTCWIAYFDILGFKELLNKYNGPLDMFVEDYNEKIQKEAEAEVGPWQDKAQAAWFSDTYLFFSFNDTIESFCRIYLLSQWFFDALISEEIPVRGALTSGDFYADDKNHIYVGPGLIDAYEYSEKQNWIGLVITPSVKQKLKGTDFSDYPHPTDFIKYDVPVKKKKNINGMMQTELAFEKLYAYKLSHFPGGLSYAEEIIRRMYQIAKNKFGKDQEFIYKDKYENTLKFIENLK
jgi:hypothetical protein